MVVLHGYKESMKQNWRRAISFLYGRDCLYLSFIWCCRFKRICCIFVFQPSQFVSVSLWLSAVMAETMADRSRVPVYCGCPVWLSRATERTECAGSCADRFQMWYVLLCYSIPRQLVVRGSDGLDLCARGYLWKNRHIRIRIFVYWIRKHCNRQRFTNRLHRTK